MKQAVQNNTGKIYFAPMEGVTGYVFRNLHHELFPGIDRYYTPFLSANHTHSFKSKEGRDIDPANNHVPELIPQFLTNSAEDFRWAAVRMSGIGYNEINFNLGCPSSTVTAKRKGAGFLAYPDDLDAFFNDVFNGFILTGNPVRVSVKTRLGVHDPSEAAALMKIYNRYPLTELIIHARIKDDMYKGSPRLDAFEACLSECVHPVCYNGDIYSVEDYEMILKRFPGLSSVMIGRGLVSDPALITGLRNISVTGSPGSVFSNGNSSVSGSSISISSDSRTSDTGASASAGDPSAHQKLLMDFHDRLFEGWSREMAPKDAVFHLKEVWYYMSRSFPGYEKEIRAMLKSKKPDDYVSAAARLRSLL